MSDEQIAHTSGKIKTVAKKCERLAELLDFCRNVEDATPVFEVLEKALRLQACELEKVVAELRKM